ncbi:MAG: 3',5'-cyclic-nucleotide phosphodiesterase [Chloracidobacterium sp.]|nr:3',5'-cyclic-nucleotide phosphodiesterase [Chloracidobacterium sp.]
MPSTFDDDGRDSGRQHLTCMVVDGAVAFDAGSLAMAADDHLRSSVRDVVISHAHLDHIAGLPLFIDDLFSELTEPVRIHGLASVIQVLEEHIFNWSIYPRFSELTNKHGKVIEYLEFEPGESFSVKHLSVLPVEVNHRVPSCGFVINDGASTIAVTGDTAPTDLFWQTVNSLPSLNALIIECAFPNELSELAAISHHLTPSGLSKELTKLERTDCRIYVSNLKPTYRDEIVRELDGLRPDGLEVLTVARDYIW